MLGRKRLQTIFDPLRTFTSFLDYSRTLRLEPTRSRSLQYSNNRSSCSGHYVVDSKYRFESDVYRWKWERWITRRRIELETLELVQSMEIGSVC